MAWKERLERLPIVVINPYTLPLPEEEMEETMGVVKIWAIRTWLPLVGVCYFFTFYEPFEEIPDEVLNSLDHWPDSPKFAHKPIIDEIIQELGHPLSIVFLTHKNRRGRMGLWLSESKELPRSLEQRIIGDERFNQICEGTGLNEVETKLCQELLATSNFFGGSYKNRLPYTDQVIDFCNYITVRLHNVPLERIVILTEVCRTIKEDLQAQYLFSCNPSLESIHLP